MRAICCYLPFRPHQTPPNPAPAPPPAPDSDPPPASDSYPTMVLALAWTPSPASDPTPANNLTPAPAQSQALAFFSGSCTWFCSFTKYYMNKNIIINNGNITKYDSTLTWY